MLIRSLPHATEPSRTFGDRGSAKPVARTARQKGSEMYLEVVQAGVVVPVFREDSDILDRCLGSWPAEDPGEVIDVPGLRDVEAITGPASRRPPIPGWSCGHSRSPARTRRWVPASANRAGRPQCWPTPGTAWEPGALKAVQAGYQTVYQPNARAMPAARPTRAPTEAHVGAGQHAGRDGRRAAHPGRSGA